MFEQEKEISQIIEKGLEEILAGSATVEEVAHRHPDQSEELRLELDAALWLISRGEKLSPRPGFIRASRGRVVARVRQEQAASGWLSRLSSVFGHILMRRAARSAVALLMILAMLMLGTGVVSASQSAVPGESLYPVKRIYEQVSFSITVDAVQRASLSVEFSEHRLSEAEELVTRGNFEDLETALEAFEDQVNQSVDLLLQVSEDQAAREAAAAQITSDLATNAERLESLAARVPAAARDRVRHAHEAANHGASVAAAVANNEMKSTPAPALTFTPSPGSTQLLAPGDPSTQLPQNGPGSGNYNGNNNGNNGNHNGNNNGNNGNHNGNNNGNQNGNSGNNGNNNNGNPNKDKPTKEPKNNPQQGKPTPKPTNVNRPEKPTAKPTNVNKPPKDNPPNSPGPPENKPPKEDKPPKDNPSNSPGPPENKPPKEDKPPNENKPPKHD